VLALLAVILNVPVSLAIAVIVFPKIFRYVHNLLAKTYRMEHITTARAKGLSETRVLLFHAIPVAAPQILALAGISVSLALGASIPVEALCGIPGIGQLAWQAALGRDLPLLVNLTVVVTLVTLLANSGADVIAHVSRSKA
jgi:peptide/nickel transport system permease protein